MHRRRSGDRCGRSARGTVARALPRPERRRRSAPSRPSSARLTSPQHAQSDRRLTRRHGVHRPPRADGVVAFRDRRGHAHSSPGGAGRDDHRLGNRRHPPGVPRARKHGDAERAGACGRGGRARYRRSGRSSPRPQTASASSASTPRPCCARGTPPRGRARGSRRPRSSRGSSPRRTAAPASSTSASGPTTRKP